MRAVAHVRCVPLPPVRVGLLFRAQAIREVDLREGRPLRLG